MKHVFQRRDKHGVSVDASCHTIGNITWMGKPVSGNAGIPGFSENHHTTLSSRFSAEALADAIAEDFAVHIFSLKVSLGCLDHRAHLLQ